MAPASGRQFLFLDAMQHRARMKTYSDSIGNFTPGLHGIPAIALVAPSLGVLVTSQVYYSPAALAPGSAFRLCMHSVIKSLHVD